MRAIRYSFDEAVLSLWRRRRSNSVAVATIAAAILVLGTLLMGTSNLEGLLSQWAEAAELSVYLSDDATPEARATVEQMLRESDLVTEFEFVSKEDALARFARDFPELAAVADDGGANPIPASFEARVPPASDETAALGELAARLDAVAGVDDVRLDQRWLERLATAIGVVRGVGALVVLVLLVAAALTVANTVRLSCIARSDEIEIMRLVGAPLAYVRGPFVFEGILQGGVGASLALSLLAAGFPLGDSMYGASLRQVLGVDAVRFLPPLMGVLLVLGGMAVGCVGGLLAALSRRETPTTS
ncbi:MAG: ABC transporter permease [Acidobacteria bacterium]|nr:ABC transporter permease [Acidobacteriota bacterium]